MEIIKQDGKIILYDDEKTIEEYSLNEEISFKNLIEYLLSINLEKKLTMPNYDDSLFSEEEIRVIKLIVNLINDYNTKVDEFIKFISLNNEG